jgi:hypothetical protein
VVERGGLENRCARERTVGSNPTPSASKPLKTHKERSRFEPSVRLAAVCPPLRRAAANGTGRMRAFSRAGGLPDFFSGDLLRSPVRARYAPLPCAQCASKGWIFATAKAMTSELSMWPPESALGEPQGPSLFIPADRDALHECRPDQFLNPVMILTAGAHRNANGAQGVIEDQPPILYAPK